MSAVENVVIRVDDDGDHDFDWWMNRGRRWFVAKASRVISASDLIVQDSKNVVRATGRIYGVLKDIEDGTNRVSIEVLPNEDSPLLGKEIWRSKSQNPVAYMSNIEVISE